MPGIITSRITASGVYLAGLVERGGAVGGGVDLEALELQAHREQLDDVGLIVDDEDPGFRNVFWECSHSHRPMSPNILVMKLQTDCQLPVSLTLSSARRLPDSR